MAATSTRVARKSLGKRLAIVLLLALVALASVPGYFIVRERFFAPTFAVVSIRPSTSYQDSGLPTRAWALPVAKEFHDGFASQSNGSVCGPSSLANVLTSLGLRSNEASVLDGSGRCWLGVCWGGLSLDALADLAREKSHRKVTVLRDLSYEKFRELLPSFNDPTRRYIVNFHRGMLFGKGGGHHSPIGGYLEPEDLVFVLDVNRDFRPWLVEPHRLYDAMNTIDSASEKKRGLLVIEQRGAASKRASRTATTRADVRVR